MLQIVLIAQDFSRVALYLLLAEQIDHIIFQVQVRSILLPLHINLFKVRLPLLLCPLGSIQLMFLSCKYQQTS